MSELWYTEKQTKNFGITMKVNKTLHTEQTEFQHLEMVETEEFGNMLFLDGMVMTSEKTNSYITKWWRMSHYLRTQIRSTFL